MRIELHEKDYFDFSVAKKITNYKIIKVENDFIYFKNRLFLDNIGLITIKNKTVEPEVIVDAFRYEYISSFEGGFAIVRKNQKYGLINESGIEIIEPKYDELEYLGAGIYFYKMSSSAGIIKSNGQIINDTLRPDITDCQLYDDIIITSSNKGSSVIDLDGNILIDSKYKDIIFMEKNRLLVRKFSKKWQIVDYQDNLVKSWKQKYTHVPLFKNKFVLAETSNGRCLIDSDGNRLHAFYELSDFKNGVAWFKDEKGYGLINDQGKILIRELPFKPIFLGKVWAITRDQSLYYLYDSEGFTNNSIELNKIHNYNGFSAIKRNNLYGIVDEYGQVLIQPKYSDIYLTKCEDICVFQDGEDMVLVSKEGKELKRMKILPMIKCQRVGNLVYYSDGFNFGVVDTSGKEIIPFMKMVDKFLIVNNNYIIIDNYLFRVDDIKVKYYLEAEIYKDGLLEPSQEWTFDNKVDRDKKSLELYKKLLGAVELSEDTKVKRK